MDASILPASRARCCRCGDFRPRNVVFLGNELGARLGCSEKTTNSNVGRKQLMPQFMNHRQMECTCRLCNCDLILAGKKESLRKKNQPPHAKKGLKQRDPCNCRMQVRERLTAFIWAVRVVIGKPAVPEN